MPNEIAIHQRFYRAGRNENEMNQIKMKTEIFTRKSSKKPQPKWNQNFSSIRPFSCAHQCRNMRHTYCFVGQIICINRIGFFFDRSKTERI